MWTIPIPDPDKNREFEKQLKYKAMKEFKIEVPQGYEIDRENSTFECIKFKEVKKELPKTWKELVRIKGFFSNRDSEIIEAYTVSMDDSNRNVFPTKEEAEASISLAQLCQLRDRYNDGWKPDWSDSDEPKYCIFFDEENACNVDHYNARRVLHFKSKELADIFLKNFEQLILTAKPLL